MCSLFLIHLMFLWKENLPFFQRSLKAFFAFIQKYARNVKNQIN